MLRPVTKDTAELLDAFISQYPHNPLSELARRASGDAERVSFAGDLSSWQPDTVGVMDAKIGFEQSEFIGQYLLPDVPCGANEEGSYQKFDKDAFYVSDDVVTVNGSVRGTDQASGFTKVELKVHGRKATIDPREIRAAAFIGANIVEQRFSIPRSKVELWKEYQKALLFTTYTNYADSNSYSTLSGATQWTHASSDPLTAIWDKIEYIRSQIGKRPRAFWCGPKPGKALSLHPILRALIQYGADKNAPAAPIALETMALIFKLAVYQGDAIVKLSMNPGVGFTDCWGDNAGLTFTGPANVVSPKFGLCAVSVDYPKVIDFFDEDASGEGSLGVKYLDAYNPVVSMPSAGYLWMDVTA